MRPLYAFFGLLIAGGAIGMAMPDDVGSLLAAPAGEEQTSIPPTAKLALATTTQSADYGESLTLERERDGHFYADVSIDGQSARMLIDTGASVIALTGQDAAALGISWDENAVAPVAQGANGPVYGVHAVLPHVELGGFEAENVPAVIIPEGLFVSLLGQSFLSRVKTVEITGNNLMMSN